MRTLGLDVGDKRIGVALSDPLGLLATPLLVFERKDNLADISFIQDLVAKKQVGRIIVGLPQFMDGSIGPQAEKVKTFTLDLAQKSLVPVEFRDERLTTVAAKQLLQEAGLKKRYKNKKGEFDAAAAAVILQSYLNESRPLQFPGEDDNESQ